MLGEGPDSAKDTSKLGASEDSIRMVHMFVHVNKRIDIAECV